MTERLYYADPNLLEFNAQAVAVYWLPDPDLRLAIVLDRSAFYPTSGGQLYDTGWLMRADALSDSKLRVSEVGEREDGAVVHFVDVPPGMFLGVSCEVALRGVVDAARRRDHMQQHTGQHLLSAVFIELFHAPTVSFHMGDETCTIDLDTKSLTSEQIHEVERRANKIITDDVPVEIKFASLEEAKAMGVRKIPPELTDKLRLIEIRGHDLTACGGTHVSRTGEIGAILLRKIEKVKQGVRVEFVCGGRAVARARKDFDTLTAAAALLSSHIYDVPEQIRKTVDESKSAGKREQKTLAELAELMAAALVADTGETNGIRLVKHTFADRDLAFVKLLAQKMATHANVVALLASTTAQPVLVFAQSAGGRFDMGALMKEVMASLGGRGGGSHDMAQGGAPADTDVETVVKSVASKIIGT